MKRKSKKIRNFEQMIVEIGHLVERELVRVGALVVASALLVQRALHSARRGRPLVRVDEARLAGERQQLELHVVGARVARAKRGQALDSAAGVEQVAQLAGAFGQIALVEGEHVVERVRAGRMVRLHWRIVAQLVVKCHVHRRVTQLFDTALAARFDRLRRPFAAANRRSHRRLGLC